MRGGLDITREVMDVALIGEFQQSLCSLRLHTSLQFEQTAAGAMPRGDSKRSNQLTGPDRILRVDGCDAQNEVIEPFKNTYSHYKRSTSDDLHLRKIVEIIFFTFT